MPPVERGGDVLLPALVLGLSLALLSLLLVLLLSCVVEVVV